MRIHVELRGSTPLMMHNERLSNAEDPHAIAIKELTSKGTNQTPRDKEEISKLEWHGGLYTNGSDEIVIPSANLIKCVRETATITKEGKKVARALTPLSIHAPLIYPGGPKKLDALFADKTFVDRRQVKVGRGRITRTRPVFHQWALAIDFELLDDVMSFADVQRLWELAGLSTGLCDGRILGYGRFTAAVKKV
jgi:hypothetical protein